jgi:hypothetical protein
MKHRFLISSLVVSLGVGLASAAWAGYKQTANVYISAGSTSTYAFGSLASARASADTNQDIGCLQYYLGNSSYYTSCWAEDATGHYVSCYSQDAAFFHAATAIKGDSALGFNFTNSSGLCTSLEIENDSSYAPKQP